METIRVGLYLSTVSLLLGLANVPSRGEDPTPANLLVTIQGLRESGGQSAHLYIFSEDKKDLIGARQVSDRIMINLPVGDYRIYAALTTNTFAGIDHYSSPEARIHLTQDDLTPVILSLRKAEDSDMHLTETARHKLGIDEELAKDLN